MLSITLVVAKIMYKFHLRNPPWIIMIYSFIVQDKFCEKDYA